MFLWIHVTLMQNHNKLGTSLPMDQLRLVSALYIDPELNLQTNLLGFFHFCDQKNALQNTCKNKIWHWRKKRRQERKKEVGALIAGHSHLDTQPILKFSVKENEVPTEKRVWGIFRFPFVTHFMSVSLRKSGSRFDFLVWNAIIPLIRDICKFPHNLF